VCRERASGRADKKDDELAASHSALLIHDDGITISDDLAYEVIAPPSNAATTSRPSTAANPNKSSLRK